MIIEDVNLSSYILDKTINGWLSGICGKGHYEQISLRRPSTFFGKYNDNPLVLADGDCIEEAYFGGVLFPYYGHFIIETLSILPNIPNDNKPILFIRLNDTVCNCHSTFFDDIGLSNRVIFSNKTKSTHVKKLHVLDQTTVVNANITYKFVNYLQSLFSNEKGTRRIYVSRDKCQNAKIKNEAAFQKKILKLGFEIVHPESLTIKEQVSLYESASIIIGIEGSALHTLMFCSFPKTVVVLRRRNELVQNFRLQSAVQPHIKWIEIGCMNTYAQSFNDVSEMDIDSAIDSIKNLLNNN